MHIHYEKGYFIHDPLLIRVIISGEDGRSRAEQLLHILRQIDQYVSSPVEWQRIRGCRAAHEMLLKFRTLCASGYCMLGCHGSCTHNKQLDHALNRNFSSLPCTLLVFTSINLCICYGWLLNYFLLYRFQLHLYCQVVMRCF